MNIAQKYYLPWHFFLKKEFAGIGFITLLFFCFPLLVRNIDITSAPIDPGILSAVILTIAALLIFKAVTWWLIKTIWPVLAEYSTNHFERNFKSLLPWQKIIIYLGFYLLLLFAFIATLGALL